MEKQKTAILQMFYGQRGDCEKVKCSSKYREYANNASQYYEKLREKLKDIPEGLDLLSNFYDWTERAHCAEIDANYAEGFKFGLLIGVEAGESKYE